MIKSNKRFSNLQTIINEFININAKKRGDDEKERGGREAGDKVRPPIFSALCSCAVLFFSFCFFLGGLGCGGQLEPAAGGTNANA